MENHKIPLDSKGDFLYYIKARGLWARRACAMMQEIAAKAGNFCGVCPRIGRLRLCAAYIVAAWKAGAKPVSFMPGNDTHGLAYRELRPYPDKTEYGKLEELHNG